MLFNAINASDNTRNGHKNLKYQIQKFIIFSATDRDSCNVSRHGNLFILLYNIEFYKYNIEFYMMAI